MKFSDLPLHPDLARATEAMGFEQPTPIQEKSIPPALEGSDVLGSAQTGSGKTVAFVLPVLHRLLSEPPRQPHAVRAVILAPVRELADQVEATLRDCAQFTGIKTALVIGGASWAKQVQALQGADVLVATPGRLLDHLKNHKGFHLRDCRALVLDEADRMLDMGFLPDVRDILSRLPRERQTLMFSATVPSEIERLVGQFMRRPVRIQIDPPRRPAEGITQAVYPVSSAQKYDLLVALLKRPEVQSALVFTSTKRRADLVHNVLGFKGVPAAAIHSDLSQSRRNEVLQGFRDQKFQFLVATDIAARGLDIRHVSHVVNFDPPSYAENYLHRIGRTARAFTVGDAWTLMSPEEKPLVESIERFIGSDIPRKALEGFPYDVPPRLESYKTPLHQKFRFRRKSLKTGRRMF